MIEILEKEIVKLESMGQLDAHRKEVLDENKENLAHFKAVIRYFDSEGCTSCDKSCRLHTIV